jgi:signal recognition particle GTPase
MTFKDFVINKIGYKNYIGFFPNFYSEIEMVEVATEWHEAELASLSPIKATKTELLDTVINLMAVLDTPIGRRQNKGELADEVRKLARVIIESNSIQK